MVRIGWLLIVGGLAVLVWLAWLFFGSNALAKHQQGQTTEQVVKAWAQEQPANADALIRIPRFGSSYVVPVVEGVGESQLSKGFAHFPKSAKVGDEGNYALAAHRVTHGEPLRHMPELQPGDKVYIETRTATYTYVLDTGGDDLIVPLTSTWVIGPKPVNPKKGGVGPTTDSSRLLTLTTCSEIFHTDNRMIAFGHLVDTVHKIDQPTG